MYLQMYLFIYIYIYTYIDTLACRDVVAKHFICQLNKTEIDEFRECACESVMFFMTKDIRSL